MDFAIKNGTLHYEIDGQGTPILFIHGMELNIDSWRVLTEPILAETAFQRIYVDLPGMGDSQFDLSVASSDAIFDILVTFVQTIIGEQPFYVAGHSYGGYLAWALADAFGEQVLGQFLSAPVVTATHAARILPAHQAVELPDLPNEVWSEKWFDDFAITTYRHGFAQWQLFVQAIIPGVEKFDMTFEKALEADYVLQQETRLKTTRTFVPTVMLLGQADVVVGYAEQLTLARQFAHLDVVLLAEAGHNLSIDQPDVFAFYLKKWLGI